VQQWENRARQRAATWFYPDSSEPVTKGQIVLKIGDHDKSGSEQRGSRTSSLYCVCLSVCLSVCAIILHYVPTWHCALKSILDGPVAQHTDRSCIMLLACMSVFLQHTESQTSASAKNTDTMRDN